MNSDSENDNSNSEEEGEEKGKVIQKQETFTKEFPASKILAVTKRLSENKGYEKEFEELQEKSDVNVFSDFSESLKWTNRSKNRFSNVLPCNFSQKTGT